MRVGKHIMEYLHEMLYVLTEENVVVAICQTFVVFLLKNFILFDVVAINELLENVDDFFLFFDYFFSKV